MKHPAIKIKKFLQGDFNNMGKMIDDCDMLSGGKGRNFYIQYQFNYAWEKH